MLPVMVQVQLDTHMIVGHLIWTHAIIMVEVEVEAALGPSHQMILMRCL